MKLCTIIVNCVTSILFKIDEWIYIRYGAVTSLNSVSMVTKYMPPCCKCKASYVWYLKQSRRSTYINEQV